MPLSLQGLYKSLIDRRDVRINEGRRLVAGDQKGDLGDVPPILFRKEGGKRSRGGRISIALRRKPGTRANS